LTPRIWNQVDSTADGPDAMALGTANGPIRLGAIFSMVVWAACRMTWVEGPPSPTMTPMRSSRISSAVMPESASASSKAIWAQAVPLARKRAARRSTRGAQSSAVTPIDGGAQTWDRKPYLMWSGAAITPDLALRSDSVTSAAPSPMEETMPSPVTTTRRMLFSSCPCTRSGPEWAPRLSRLCPSDDFLD
jgi:hypothetical protein